MRRRGWGIALVAAAALAAPATALAAVPAGTTYTETTFPSADGTVLHADVLRPSGLPADVRTPVLMIAGPYSGHGGGPLTPNIAHDGPEPAYTDQFNRVKLFQRGWSLVQVDLRGYGGSAGCPDWVGPGEQSDVKAAVEWAAAQPWSTGRVALYGISYEGATGVMGLGTHPHGLAAAVIGDPLGDAYRWSYSHGVRIHHSIVSPPAYLGYEAQPGALGDSPDYLERGAMTNPSCSGANMEGNQLDDPDADFWVARRNVQRALGTSVPLFFSQGLLDDNVRPDDSLFGLWRSATGPKRAWFGQFGHNFPSDKAVGMDSYDDAVFRFLDHYVRQVALADAPTDRDPEVTVGSNDGAWRGEAAWPPDDVTVLRTPLRTGDYADVSGNFGTAGDPYGAGWNSSPASRHAGGRGLWTISPPLAYPVHLSGLPKLTVEASAPVAGANLVVDLYDIDADGNALLVTREAMLVRDSAQHELLLHAQDWQVAAGHRLGVLLTASNDEFWVHRPTGQPVTVKRAAIDLPFRTFVPPAPLRTKPPVLLTEYLANSAIALDAATIEGAQAPFALPGSLRPRPAATGAGSAAPAAAAAAAAERRLARLTVRAGASRRRVTAMGNAPSGARVRVRLVRRGLTIATRTVVARFAAWRATLRAPRAGVYRVEASAVVDGARLRAHVARLRVR